MCRIEFELDLRAGSKVYLRLMGSYRISDVAERTGFSTSALRYYELTGVLNAVDRTDAGYRIYDDRSVDQLRFIGRAKRLGLSLEEITELARLWADDECAPVHHRMSQLVDEKREMVAAQVRELTAFGGQLDVVRDRLREGPKVGACDESCGCASDGSQSVEFGRGAEPAPIACTLDPAAMSDRVDQWQVVLAGVVARERIDEGLRLAFGSRDVVVLADLVEQEQRCCSFFEFAIGITDRVTLEVRAPADARPILEELFGGAS